MKTSSRFAWIALAACIVIPAFADDSQPYVYVRSNVNQPWGQTTNEDAMDEVFGSGAWTQAYYETMDVNSTFSSSNSFIFLEGGDSSFTAFQNLLQHSGDKIYSWIYNGGHLLIMSAPNDPLQGATLYLPNNIVLNADAFYGSAASSAFAIDTKNAIFNGPNTTSYSFTGNFFSHGYFTGNSVQALMQSNLNEVVLGQCTVGWGLMVFGGMTTDNFHSPQPDAHALLENILSYTSNWYPH